jgi:hypothetical protein
LPSVLNGSAEHYRVQLTRVPGHGEIMENEVAGELARIGSECPFIRLELVCFILEGVLKTAIKNWMNTNTGSPYMDINM